ncbi:Gfo/Idh/MocA family oxidoreductase [Cnuibacter physcomitrellae]|uniref:Gfo/Idh/MocA family protein n=1 Tax=Cnuibacter physcomitrellae TaxID=1619308 RepID=UPI0021760AD5|nr:Gfo/Idh/MocA family oxidoreductase [Cnuibacter physcomitrellae]MCS5497840.1 Gfo/Idh/MocA family oxidoreductase [Cnuibacter physcomitrellae]
MTNEPLRIGVLGAARINEMTLFAPARDVGARIVAVAARDRGRAESYARENGIERVVDDYAALVSDAEVEAVYNPLPNGLHTPWNLAAIVAGKHVLGEKPFASNAAEAEEVHRAAQERPDLVVFDGLHYRYHPVFRRLQEIVQSGEIGEVQQVRAVMTVPVPDLSDIRWSWPLAGGSMMDLGIYCIDVIQTFAASLGGEPRLLTARTGHLEGTHPDVDAWSELTYELPNGALGVAEMNLIGPQHFVITVVGSKGTAHQANLSYVHTDDRILVFTGGDSRVEELGRTSSFTYQMRAFVDAVRHGTPHVTTTESALRDMRAVDAAYAMAGLPPRPSYE